MQAPLATCLGLGDQLGATLQALAARGQPPRGELVAGETPPSDAARLLVFLAPDVEADEILALATRLPGSGLLLLLTYAPDAATGGAERFQHLLEACRKLAGRRRVATVVGPDLASLSALAAMATELDEHVLAGPGVAPARSFVQAHAVAVRLWSTAESDPAFVTRDASDQDLAEALGLLQASQLVEQLLEPEAVSPGAAAGELASRIPAYVREAGRPLRELLDAVKLDLEPPPHGLDSQALEAWIDQTCARLRTDIGHERLHLLEQARSALDGATELQTNQDRGGLLAQIDRSLVDGARRSGAAGAVRTARTLKARFEAEGAGSPPMQLEPRIAALEAQREQQRQHARQNVGARDPGASQSQQTAAQILKLERAMLIGATARDFWRRTLDHLARRTAEYEQLAASLRELHGSLPPRLDAAWARLAVAPRDAAVGRFMRTHQLTRATAERVVLPGASQAQAPGTADQILQALTAAARRAVGPSTTSSAGVAASFITAHLKQRGLLSAAVDDDRARDHVLYGAGAEHDARKLALSLDSRPRSTQVPTPGYLAWLRLTPGLPLTALARRLGLDVATETSGNFDVVAPLGEGLSAAAARAEYAIACREVAEGRNHEAIAAYRKAASAAGIHKDPLGPLMTALVRTMQARDANDFVKVDDEIDIDALATARPEEVIARSISELAAGLRKFRELGGDSGRVFYLREVERSAWALAEDARSTLADPERTLLAAAFERLGSLLRAEVGEVYGKARVTLSLITKRLSYVTQTRVEIKLVNVSQATAYDLRLRLVSSERLRLLSETEVKVAKLNPGIEVVLGFDVKPLKAGRRPIKLRLGFADLAGQRTETNHSLEPECIPVRPNFERIELNPFVAGPPIRTAEMFFGRRDVLEFVVSNLRGQHQDSILLLHGARRTGKSSVFYRLGHGDLLEEYVPVYLDLQGLGDFTTESLLAGMARRLVRAFTKRAIELSVQAPPAAEFTDQPFETFMEFLEDFEEAIAGRKRALVMIDEFEILESKASQGRLSIDVFPFLRSVAQHSASLSFILAGTRRLDEMDSSYWSSFYGLVRDRALGFLALAEMSELVTRPLAGRVEVDDLALETIFRLTSGHPYYTQLVCQTLVSELNRRAERNFVLSSDVLEAATLVLSLGGGQITHEWSSLRSAASRLTLAALAELTPDASVWVERDELAARLDQNQAAVSPEELGRVLAELARRELITSPSAQGPVRYRMDLLRQWVRQEKPIAAVLAE